MIARVVGNLLAASALAMSFSGAYAAGMGRLSVLSSLGQNLHAEIELISVTPQERGTLSAKLGSARAYELSNLPLGATGSSGVRVSVEHRASGEPYIRITSQKPVYEPFLNLLIELTSLSGPLTREFVVLLDPPEITPARVVEVQPPVATPPAPQPAPVATQGADNDYGPVRPGETLSRIAAKVRAPGTSLQQTMRAIFLANPAAFINNNMNLLKTGHRLRIPASEQTVAPAAPESTQPALAPASARAPVAATRESADSKPARKPPAPGTVAAPAKPAATGKPVVKLSSGKPGGKATIEDRVRMLEEDLAARERALNDANERIRRLEKAAATRTPADERPK